MEYGRYKWNCFLWAVYTILLSVCLTVQTGAVCRMLGISVYGYYPVAAAVCAVFLFLMIFMPIRFLASRRKGKKDLRDQDRRSAERKTELWECLFMLFVLAAALALRLMFMTGSGQQTAGENLSEAVRVCAFILSQTGQTSVTPLGLAMVLELVTQVAGMTMLYMAMRILSCRMQAVWTVLWVCLLPSYLYACRDARGESFYFMMYVFLLLQTGFLFRQLARPKIAAWPLVLVSGLISGAAVFWEIRFLPVFFLAFFGILQLKSRVMKNSRAAAAGLYLGAFLCGYALLVSLLYFLQNQNYLDILCSRMGVLSLAAPDSLIGLAVEGAELMPLVCFAFLYVFGFFRQKGNYGTVWILPFVCHFVMGLLTGFTGHGWSLLMLAWIIMGGMGLHSACSPECDNKEKAKQKNPAAVAGMSSGTQNGEPMKPRSGEPIPNPLPVPKKNSRKVMNYAFEPEESRMCFDIDTVKEDDDFELQ